MKEQTNKEDKPEELLNLKVTEGELKTLHSACKVIKKDIDKDPVRAKVTNEFFKTLTGFSPLDELFSVMGKIEKLIK